MEKQTPGFSWLLIMAWRDSRKNLSRLLLFVSSIIMGIAALVAIYSFANNLRDDIDKQAATLIGAHIAVHTNKKPESKIVSQLDALGNKRSYEQSFASMVYFQKSKGTRLVQIKAIEGDFPYYGKIESKPASASTTFRNKKEALIDKTIMLQFNAQPGDSVKIGDVTFKIAGILQKAPGQTGISASIAPIVYIPLRYLEQTGLSQKGSRINYNYYFKYDNPEKVAAEVKRITPGLEKEGLDIRTVETQKKDTGRAFQDLTDFLSLVGFVALLLGCIGVASAIHIYIREKINTIAILRCLGVKGSFAFLIYLIQIAGIGLIGSVLGAASGVFIQQVLPEVLKDILPLDITVTTSWEAITEGILLGLFISVLFALLPLIAIRNISPLNTLRIAFAENENKNDYLKIPVYLLIVLFVYLFSYFQLHSWIKALYFTLGVAAAFLILVGLALLLTKAIRRFFPTNWSYLWRQGLANLFRPNNQTVILIVSIGLGTAFISTLFFIQDVLIKRVTLSASANQPNMVLFDIQTGQKEKVEALTKEFELPLIQKVPIVTMRVEEINGRTAAEAKKAGSLGIPPSAFNSELRATFRDTLISSEKIIKGKWTGSVKSLEDPVYVSLEEGHAERSKLKIGDSILFNVQGALISSIVGSVRKVDWNRVQTNFRVLFPAGVLEEAPQFHVIMTRVSSPQVSVAYQQAVVRNFPNVSIIDLDLILSVLDEVLGKIGFVIRFMAAFSIITGVVVLIASVLISKYQRIQESVLLRTIGASRKQVRAITAIEYLFLGGLAAGIGILISVVASWALSKFVFETSFQPNMVPVLVLFVAITALTVAIGLFNLKGILSRPPLEVLRREV